MQEVVCACEDNAAAGQCGVCMWLRVFFWDRMRMRKRNAVVESTGVMLVGLFMLCCMGSCAISGAVVCSVSDPDTKDGADSQHLCPNVGMYTCTLTS